MTLNDALRVQAMIDALSAPVRDRENPEGVPLSVRLDAILRAPVRLGSPGCWVNGAHP